MKRLVIPNTVVVEGKYDKNKLSGVIDANIVTTNGFSIFNEKQKELMLKKLSEKLPVIVLTDSDGAGLVIRNRINSVLDKSRVIHLYIPEIKGREKRKTHPSKAGTLGVEGMENSLLYSLFAPFASDAPERDNSERNIKKTDLYSDGFYGGKNSASLRKKLQKALSLPENISASALIDALNILYTREEYKRAAEKIKEDNDD